MVFNQDYIMGSFARNFYGYYMDDPERIRFREIRKDVVENHLPEAPVSQLIQRRMEGRDSCPVRLRSVFFFDGDEIRAVANQLTRHLGTPATGRVRVVAFSVNDAPRFPFDIVFPEGPTKAFVVLVDQS